ncbi:MAG: methionyl-tRNA formyltransferase [Zoogloeaceae bacterium]|jgi:methionyl-tRNA formyltransferase|nr:methionyl-tRNA formyltransferase [Zoogloeaceae bacterium]
MNIGGISVGFGGTPEFARVALAALLDAGFNVPLVLTQPDRPSGRGQKLQASPVKALALERGIAAIHQPDTLKDPASHAPLKAADLDVLVVAAYGLILPQAVLDIPRLGCLNIHASLLPRWRGAAPIQRAIEAGDRETGVTIMRVEAALDTGPMLLSEALPIAGTDTAATLHNRLAAQGARLIVQALRNLDCLTPVVQPAAGITYARKIGKAEALLDWERPASELARRLRAFDPFPGGAAMLGDMPLKLWHGVATSDRGVPGTVLSVADDGIVIACGEGSLRITELQKSGGKRLAAADFLHGTPIAAGMRFGC